MHNEPDLVEKERREKQAATLTETLNNGVSVNKLTETHDENISTKNRNFKDENANATNTKLAKLKGTNRTYIAKARNLKNENPESFEELKNGEKTRKDIRKESIKTKIENYEKFVNSNYQKKT